MGDAGSNRPLSGQFHTTHARSLGNSRICDVISYQYSLGKLHIRPGFGDLSDEDLEVDPPFGEVHKT